MLHVMLTEVILCHGGNQVIVQMLNRLGAVASLDTCHRLTTQVVLTRITTGIKPYLIPTTLSIVSVDNIDILQPHAVVSALDATRSWHGTSVQLMQPMPISGTLSEADLARPAALPQNSPPYTRPLKRRRRTLSEQCSPQTVVPSSQAPSDHPSEAILYERPHVRPSIDNFKMTLTEKETYTQLQKDVHFAMLLKYFHTEQNKAFHLPSIPCLTHCLKKQAHEMF